MNLIIFVQLMRGILQFALSLIWIISLPKWFQVKKSQQYHASCMYTRKDLELYMYNNIVSSLINHIIKIN